MAAQAQLLANRLNAQKSTAPRTPEPTLLSRKIPSSSARDASAKQVAHPAGPTNHNLIVMQNKPNFLDVQMSVSPVKTMNYEQRTMNDEPTKQTQSNPIYALGIKPNFEPPANSLTR